MSTTTVTSKGQVTIPIDVRNELGLRPGSRVSFVRNDEGVYEVRPHQQSIRAFKGVVAPPKAPVGLDEMARAVERGAAGEMER